MPMGPMRIRREIRHLLITSVFTLLLILVLSYRFRPSTGPVSLIEGPGALVRVKYVIDGDTIVTGGGEKIRYAGIDTPERGEPFYEEARARNRGLVLGSIVRLEICMEKPRDRFGRVLAWVYVNDVSVEETLLGEGLARVITIPPCGLKRADRFKVIEGEAREMGLGIWGLEER